MQDKPASHAVSRAEKARRRALGTAFEEEVARAYERDGYTVERRGLERRQARGDGGIDLLVWLPHQPDECIAVQCKAKHSGEVDQGEVQRMLGIIQSERAVVRGVVVTTADFTRAARDLAARQPQVELIDGSALTARWGIDGAALHDRFPRRDGARLPDPPVASAIPPRFTVTVPSTPDGTKAARSTERRRHGLIVVACLLVVLSTVGYFIAHRVSQPLADPKTDVASTPIAHPPILPASAASVASATKTPAPRRPSVAKRPLERKQREAHTPDLIPNQSAEPVVIYKAADMTDAEFEAWKQRKAQRERSPAPVAVVDPVYSDSASGGSVSAETMQTILRSNRREGATTK